MIRLADMMMLSAKEIELHLSRSPKEPAVGIHIIVATRPEAKIVTGLIKSNLPCRIAFRVASPGFAIVLDQNGESAHGPGRHAVFAAGFVQTGRAQALSGRCGLKALIDSSKNVRHPNSTPVDSTAQSGSDHRRAA
jgi:S-DNA-T family DNA segregation ATPase FtsK/SpoIIIE